MRSAGRAQWRNRAHDLAVGAVGPGVRVACAAACERVGHRCLVAEGVPRDGVGTRRIGPRGLEQRRVAIRCARVLGADGTTCVGHRKRTAIGVVDRAYDLATDRVARARDIACGVVGVAGVDRRGADGVGARMCERQRRQRTACLGRHAPAQPTRGVIEPGDRGAAGGVRIGLGGAVAQSVISPGGHVAVGVGLACHAPD